MWTICTCTPVFSEASIASRTASKTPADSLRR